MFLYVTDVEIIMFFSILTDTQTAQIAYRVIPRLCVDSVKMLRISVKVNIIEK